MRRFQISFQTCSCASPRAFASSSCLETELRWGQDRAIAFADDVINPRQADRRIGVRVVVDAAKRGFVDFRPPDDDRVVLVFRLAVIGVAQQLELARPVAIIGAEARAGIVDAAVLVAHGDRVLERVGIGHRRRRLGSRRLELEAAALRLGDHPDKGNVGQRVVGIAAADVGMHAGEPDLAELLVLDVALLVRIDRHATARRLRSTARGWNVVRSSSSANAWQARVTRSRGKVCVGNSSGQM